MRQIKFRGKTLLTNVWVYGSLIIDFKDNHWIIEEGLHIDVHRIDVGGNFLPVDPKTVGQFTNLLDKNGKEIYEGDILKGGIYKEYTVEWDGEKCGWNIYYHVQHSFEVTSNVHETI